MRNNQKGQTLVEVIVASGIVTLVLSGLVSAITYGLTSVQFSRNKALATKYAQESLEWVRSKRDVSANWATFYSTYASTPTTYCMSTLSWSTTSPCTTPINDAYDKFVRTVTLTGNGAPDNDRILVQAVVTWNEGRRSSNVSLETYLSSW